MNDDNNTKNEKSRWVDSASSAMVSFTLIGCLCAVAIAMTVKLIMMII